MCNHNNKRKIAFVHAQLIEFAAVIWYNATLTEYEHFADAIIQASKLKPRFVSENEEILKKLDELFA